jgi:hypothetical protein
MSTGRRFAAEKRASKVHGRLCDAPVALKLDPTGDVLNSFIELNHIDEVFNTRQTAFEKTRMRVAGTAMSAAILGERHAG